MTEIAKLDLNELSHDGRRILLIGTAHVSEKSAELVEEVILRENPECVCLELCGPREQTLRNPEGWSNTNVFDVIKGGKAYPLLAQLLLSSFQKRLANKFGIKPGEEMRRAIAICDQEKIPTACIDREIRITLKRAWSSAGLWSLMKLLFSLLFSASIEDELSEEKIEEMKSGDALMILMQEFDQSLPGIKQSLIDERDEFMATRILQTPGSPLVAVVGAGHVPGILKHFGKEFDLDKLNEIPPPRTSLKVIAWAIPTIIIGMFIYGFLGTGSEVGLEIILSWVIANGGLSALGAIIAAAHPLTILTAFIAAPLTSLNPAVGAGWVCGLVEALLRKPRVKDLENVSEDVSSIKGFYRNRVTRVLIVMALANLGSALGTFIGGGRIVSILFSTGA